MASLLFMFDCNVALRKADLNFSFTEITCDAVAAIHCILIDIAIAFTASFRMQSAAIGISRIRNDVIASGMRTFSRRRAVLVREITRGRRTGTGFDSTVHDGNYRYRKKHKAESNTKCNQFFFSFTAHSILLREQISIRFLHRFHCSIILQRLQSLPICFSLIAII